MILRAKQKKEMEMVDIKRLEFLRLSMFVTCGAFYHLFKSRTASTVGSDGLRCRRRHERRRRPVDVVVVVVVGKKPPVGLRANLLELVSERAD